MTPLFMATEDVSKAKCVPTILAHMRPDMQMSSFDVLLQIRPPRKCTVTILIRTCKFMRGNQKTVTRFLFFRRVVSHIIVVQSSRMRRREFFGYNFHAAMFGIDML
jgi:hypothetical protein